jgi:hypothetical protein
VEVFSSLLFAAEAVSLGRMTDGSLKKSSSFEAVVFEKNEGLRSKSVLTSLVFNCDARHARVRRSNIQDKSDEVGGHDRHA